MARSVGRLLVDSLEAHDIDLIYCVPGESYLGFTNALVDNNRMRLIVCRHEGGAAFMAAADGRTSVSPGLTANSGRRTAAGALSSYGLQSQRPEALRM